MKKSNWVKTGHHKPGEYDWVVQGEGKISEGGFDGGEERSRDQEELFMLFYSVGVAKRGAYQWKKGRSSDGGGECQLRWGAVMIAEKQKREIREG